MHTQLRRSVSADPDLLFELAARVEDWPRILPHYRWVRVFGMLDSERRLVEMAARRDVAGPLSVPLWWRSVQLIDRPRRRIGFEHVAGITRGMTVEWAIDPRPNGSDVVIRHAFEPRWPAPDWLVHAVVGEYFVNDVAGRTLDYLARKAR
ncbi:MAG: SRPBCC family protein [Chloroflexi bacterium]|nr:SRPBCC family protein [Chloroflexota bacterium]